VSPTEAHKVVIGEQDGAVDAVGSLAVEFCDAQV
jgi:hypothetical protein